MEGPFLPYAFFVVAYRDVILCEGEQTNYREMTFLGIYQLSCGPIPMKIGGNRPEPIPNLPKRSKKQISQQENHHYNVYLFHFVSPKIVLTDNFYSPHDAVKKTNTLKHKHHLKTTKFAEL